MEHRTLVQRSSQNVPREPCSPIEQSGGVHGTANSYVVEDFGSAALVVQPEDEAETRGVLPEGMFNSQKVDCSAGETSLAQPEARGYTGHSAGTRSLVVLCGTVRHVADSVSEPRGATKHRANRS